MMRLSNFRSTNSRIHFNIEMDMNSLLDSTPRNVNLEQLKDLFSRFTRELSGLQVIVSYANYVNQDYRKEREAAIKGLSEAFSDIFNKISELKTILKSSLNEKVIEKEYVSGREAIDSLADQKHEYEKLSGLRSRVASFLKIANENFHEKARFYRNLDRLVKGEIKAGIILKNEDEFSFEIYDFDFHESFDDAAEMARNKEYLSIELSGHIEKLIEELTSKKRILKKLMVDKFNPWNDFEKVISVGEFLKARAEVANFWNEEFSFTENLAHHYFKCQGFYQFFEENLLVRLNEVKAKIDKKVAQVLHQYEVRENILNLYGHLPVAEFLKGGNLRLVSNEGIPGPRHHSYNALRLANDKLAKIVWSAAEQNIAKKLGGKIISPGVIIRPNKQDNRATMKTELIVLSNPTQNENPRMMLGGKFRDIISTKSENITELFEIGQNPEGISVDLDLKLSYFLSTTKMAA